MINIGQKYLSRGERKLKGIIINQKFRVAGGG
jgi:hypothetical protein